MNELFHCKPWCHNCISSVGEMSMILFVKLSLFHPYTNRIIWTIHFETEKYPVQKSSQNKCLGKSKSSARYCYAKLRCTEVCFYFYGLTANILTTTDQTGH